MSEPDRRTTIYGDQIEDGTITIQELDITNTPNNGDSLTFDSISDSFKWTNVAGDINLDGGFANATYLPSQNVDGGNA